MSAPHFSAMQAARPDAETLAMAYEDLEQAWATAADEEGRRAIIERWDVLRSRFSTWYELAQARFTQNTGDEAARIERELSDELEPRSTSLEVGFLRLLLEGPHRSELEAWLGGHALALWDLKVRAYDPAIEEARVREAKLAAEYTDLIAQAKISFRGETFNHASIVKFAQDPDRSVRKEAAISRWAWFEEHGEAFDRIYDDLVRLRHEMATTLGHRDFVELGYERMKRVDYGREDVERFRAEVLQLVVPLCERLMVRRGETLGLDRMMFWDEALADPRGNPKPLGDEAWTTDQAARVFSETHEELGRFYEMMGQRGLLDLVTREGKAAGGYTTFFEEFEVPFVFSNFNGTLSDIDVLTHEMGHAFQMWSSRELFPMEYRSPTLEACEIHSMSLEHLAWPSMEHFFGDAAERYRRIHLEGGLTFLPYGVAVDHFQHLVYEHPEASPADRHGMWAEMERTYLPWRANGGIPRLESGGRWQAQLHIYGAPFYYIDYTLALTCALQLWAWADRDRPAALEAYMGLCRRGGSAPFQALARGTGLTSPFDRGCLAEVVGHAAQRLGLQDG